MAALGVFSLGWGQLGIGLEWAATLRVCRAHEGFGIPRSIVPLASALDDCSSLPSGFSLAACILDCAIASSSNRNKYWGACVIGDSMKVRLLSNLPSVCVMSHCLQPLSRKTKVSVGGCNVCCSASDGLKNTTCELPDGSSFRRQSTPGTFQFSGGNGIWRDVYFTTNVKGTGCWEEINNFWTQAASVLQWLAVFIAVPMPLWGSSGHWICTEERGTKGAMRWGELGGE